MSQPPRLSGEVSGERLAIERAGSRVSIVLECRDEYHAIELYDQLNLDLEKGRISLLFGVKPP